MSKSPVFGVFTEECFAALVNDFAFPVDCVNFTISKCLGYAIILGSFALKVPQILSITKAKSADGMVLSALYFEMLSFSCVAAYNMLTGTPLSTYAESLVILVQNTIIVYLCWSFSNTVFSHRLSVIGAGIAFLAVVNFLPQAYWPLLMVATTLASVSGRLQQVYANYTQQSTGVLSLTTTVMQVGGTAARVFTTLAEVDDVAILASFLISLLLNVTVLAQIGLYWGQAPRNTKEKAVVSPVAKPITAYDTASTAAGSPQTRRRTRKAE